MASPLLTDSATAAPTPTEDATSDGEPRISGGRTLEDAPRLSEGTALDDIAVGETRFYSVEVAHDVVPVAGVAVAGRPGSRLDTPAVLQLVVVDADRQPVPDADEQVTFIGDAPQTLQVTARGEYRGPYGVMIALRPTAGAEQATPAATADGRRYAMRIGLTTVPRPDGPRPSAPPEQAPTTSAPADTATPSDSPPRPAIDAGVLPMAAGLSFAVGGIVGFTRTRARSRPLAKSSLERLSRRWKSRGR